MSEELDHIGVVTEKEDAHRYRIKIQPAGGCGKCRLKKICGQGDVEKIAYSSIELEKGDRVSFYYKHQAPLLASFLVYIVPLLFMIGGILGVSRIYPDRFLLQALAGLVFLSGGWGVMSLLTRNQQQLFYPVIKEKISPEKKNDR